LWTAAALGCAEQSLGKQVLGRSFVKLLGEHHTRLVIRRMYSELA